MRNAPNTVKNKTHKRATLRKILNRKRKKEHGTIGTNAIKKKLRRVILKYKPIDNVVNLGTFDLTEGERSLLQKGLSFVPTPPKVPPQDVTSGLEDFISRMKLQFHFYNHLTQTKDEPFHLKSSWVPPNETFIPLQEYFDKITDVINNHITNSGETFTSNLSQSELKAIGKLSKRRDIIIQRADKGGALASWPKRLYLMEASRQLNNTLHYSKCPKNYIPELTAQIITFLTDLLVKHEISEKTYDFLEPRSSPRTPIFYLLPKIHKPKIDDITSGRPIVSGCGSPTEKLSQFLDYYLKPIVQTIPSYVRDSKCYLQNIMQNRVSFPKGTLLATLDVKSLYTNIPQEEGIQHCLDAMTQHYGQNLPLSVDKLRQMFKIVLRGNHFEFNDQLFLQIHGTSMGTPMAPNFANTFMSRIENVIITHAPSRLRPLLWKRFIDDIIIIWEHGEKSLIEFINNANAIHDTIKFEYEISSQKINFLFTTIYFNDKQVLDNTIFIKPTDICTLLQATSFHPAHCKRGIIYSQALRYRRLITDNKELEKHLASLRANLVRRGYNLSLIDSEFLKLSNINQDDLLFPKHAVNLSNTGAHKSNNEVIPFIVPFDSTTVNMGSILVNHWHLINQNPILQRV